MAPDPETPRHDTQPAQGSDSAPGPEPAPPTDSTTLAWPPPGLGRIQGDAYAAARWLAGGAILVLPLLVSVVGEQDDWSLGFLGETVWLAALLGITGIPILLTGFAFLNRLLRRAGEAARHGYNWRLIALAACDHRRDTGFLLQGARVYAVLDPARRGRLATARFMTGGLVLGAALWLSVGFAVAVVLAARGVLGPGGVTWLTLAPAGLALAVAVVYVSWQETVLRGARKAYHSEPWSTELKAAEIRNWTSALTEREPGLVAVSESPDATVAAFQTSAAASIVMGLVALVPIFMLILASTLSPVIASIALPGFGQTLERRAAIEPLARYALEPDGSITPYEAGELLHAIGFAGGRDTVREGLRRPALEYDRIWLPDPPADAGKPDSAFTAAWFLDLIENPNAPLPPAGVAYLERLASHPGHVDLARAARAGAIDLATPRWTDPLPENSSVITLPLPPFRGVREAAYAHAGKAALEFRQGRYDAAETTLRELVTLGLRMAERGPTLLDNLIGVVIAGLGGQGLEHLYVATDRPEAEELRWARRSVENGVRIASVGRASDPLATLRVMPDVATDSMAVSGLRWEAYLLLNTLGPCLNPHRIVFGPDPSHDAWLAEVREQLVTWPGEAQLYELGRHGYLGHALNQDPGLWTRLVTLTMGGVDREGSCGRAMAAMLELD